MIIVAGIMIKTANRGIEIIFMKPVIDLMIKFANKANKGAKIKEDINDIKQINKFS